ncbi:CysB family HTH-type transcriptional regulator [Neisseria sp. Ec49-e6-T10]|uniref:CysB family HTH-type transcriptional regulator n=1 Tax=Neisseria sp. Ec49-e6-T10 TaxID=3140744 RepID=UPI003EBA08C0
MKLQQLRYILEVAKHNLNISEAAETLFTSQPGISKQIRLLEEELGVLIFIRNGKRIVSISEPGKAVLRIAGEMMRNAQNIKKIGDNFANTDSGSLSIATTHTQARYVLPKVVSEFLKAYPKVHLTIKQGSPAEACEMAMAGEVDFAIATEDLNEYKELAMLPCYDWNRSVIVPDGHPLLLKKDLLTLKDIASYPLITYEFAFLPSSTIYQAFQQEGLTPSVALSAVDTDVIKTYVRLGLGVGLLATMAYEPDRDDGIKLINTEHLFHPSTTKVALRYDCYLRGYAYHFIQLFAPTLTREKVESVLYAPSDE